MTKSSLLYLSLLASVAACSSGGGGSNNAGVSTAVNTPQANMAPFTTGTSTDAEVVAFAYNCGANATVCGAGAPTSTAIVNNAPTSFVTLTNDPLTGDVTSMQISVNNNEGGANFNHTFDLTTAAAANVAGFLEKADPGDANAGGYDVIFAGSATNGNAAATNSTFGLTYTSYGLWSQTELTATSPGAYGAIAAGELTPAADIPANFKAHYSGGAIGQLTTAAGGYHILSGTMQADADGTARTVNGSMNLNVSGGTDVATPGFWNTVSWQSAITGNHFAGTASAAATGLNSVIQTEAMQGNVAGAFYGPGGNGGPQEIGGVFNLAGTQGSTSVGAFGGKR